MPISFNNIPGNIRVPLFYAEVDPSQNAQFQIQQSALLIGQKLAGGTAPANVPVFVSNASQAKELFGVGSLLARMVEAYRRNDDFGELWCLPLADAGAGVAATFTATVTGTATAAGTLPLYIAGQRVLVPVAAGDTATVVAGKIVTAVTAATDLPVTATNAAGVVTLTARHKGALGNDIDVRLAYRGSLGGEAVPAGIAVAVAAGVTGATDPDVSAALAALGDTEFDFVACPYTDTTNLDAVAAEWGDLTGRWAWSRQLYGHVFAARRGTVGALGTFGNLRNDPHVTVVGYHDSPTPPWEWCAAWTAQAARSLKNDPARPLQTLALAGVMAPPVGSTGRFTLSERQTLLFDGIATFMIQADGTVAIERSITSYQRNAWGQADASYLDVETLYTLAYVIRRLRAVITQKFARHKLANDGTAFGAGQAIVTPRIIRAELIALYRTLEELGIVENAALFQQYLVVERNLDDPNRVDVLFPPDFVNQLRIFAVLAQFRLQYPATAA